MDSYATDNLRYERVGTLATLTLDRPDRLNAFTIQMWHEMADLGRKLVGDPEIRALVVKGAGRAFSSGIDLEVLSSGGRAPRAAADIQALQAAFDWLEEAPFPTIAALHGYALGGGLQCALACDLRVAARTTQLGILELNWAIIPDLGGTQRLPRLVGEGKAKELVYLSAKIDAEEAYRIGLIERVVDDDELDEHTRALAEELAARPPLALHGTKKLINRSFDVSLRDGLRLEAETQLECLRSDDLREAGAAAMEGRPPEFKGR